MRIYFSSESFQNWPIVLRTKDGHILCEESAYQLTGLCYNSFIGNLSNLNFLEYTTLTQLDYIVNIGNSSHPFLYLTVGDEETPVEQRVLNEESNVPWNILLLALLLLIVLFYLMKPSGRRKRLNFDEPEVVRRPMSAGRRKKIKYITTTTLY